MSADGIASRTAAIELDVRAVPGVRALYPVTALPGAPRVALVERAGAARCELRIAAGEEVAAADLIRSITAAVRRSVGSDAIEVRIEVASID